MLNMIKVGLIVTVLVVVTGCTPGYVCPLTAGPGTCSSQQDAYRATLTHNADGVSIFNSSSTTQGDDHNETL